MGGLAAIFFIGLYIAIAYWVFKRCGGSNFRWLVLALAVLIPSGDAVVGRLYLKQLCTKEGGLKVYRVAEHVDGFMEQLGTDYWVSVGSYRYSEDFPINGKVTRYERQDGQIVQMDNVLPQSQYRVRRQHIGSHNDRYRRSVFLVEGIPNGEILATDTQIAFNGGWVERFIALFSDSGGGSVAWCTNTELDPVVRHRRLVSSTLKH